MSESPEHKKSKLAYDLKRATDSQGSPSKRQKKEQETMNEKIRAKKRQNFIVACQSVSRDTYFDLQLRFHITYIPSCLREEMCKHRDPKIKYSPLPSHAEESFKIEVKSNMWWEALEVCLLSITATQYLSAAVLKEIVEIMLNAHEDPDSTYSITDILIKCQQILSQNFNAHPPCMLRRIRKCYYTFLTSPMDLKDKTFSNRNEFGSKKGLVKYCLNRLQWEMKQESPEGALINKSQNIPDDMKQSVKGLHWQKEKFEIYECMERQERIKRLFMVLDSIVELLAADLAIWVNRHPTSQGQHVMRATRPLMAQVLWPDSVLLTGSVGDTCRQIMELFALAVHLGYPDSDVTVLTTWINTMAQTFYVCEVNSNNDYPNVGKFCKKFAKDFYKVLQEGKLHGESMTRVIEAIQPAFIRYEVAMLQLKSWLPHSLDNVMEIFLNYLKNNGWRKYPTVDTALVIRDNKYKKIKIKNFIKYVKQKLSKLELNNIEDVKECYSREPTVKKPKKEIDQNMITHLLYHTMEAYLEMYRVEEVQKRLSELNELAETGIDSEDQPDLHPYGTSVDYIKIYRNIYTLLKDIILVLRELKKKGDYHETLDVFKKFGLFGN